MDFRTRVVSGGGREAEPVRCQSMLMTAHNSNRIRKWSKGGVFEHLNVRIIGKLTIGERNMVVC